MELVLGHGKLLNVELKPDVPEPAGAGRTRRGDRGRALRIRARGDPDLELQRAHVQRADGRAAGRGGRRSCSSTRPTSCRAGCSAVHPHHGLADAEAIARWPRAGSGVNVWTVNDVARARALAAAGVDGIITDDVPLVLGALGLTEVG